jgi:hypothetical protein
MSTYAKPHLLELRQHGSSPVGYITIIEQGVAPLPFNVQRIFWTYFTPESVIRGAHGHFVTEQILIALAGTIQVEVEDAWGNLNQFMLHHPTQGLYLPPDHWHTMKYSHTAIQLVLASTVYAEADYLRDKQEFVSHWQNAYPAIQAP